MDLGARLVLVPTLVLLVVPEGRLPSRRWRPVITFQVVVLALATVGFALTPWERADPPVNWGLGCDLGFPRKAGNKFMSEERLWEYIEAVYMTGTIDRIQEAIQARVDAGVEYMMLHTLTADLDQL